MPAPRAVAPIAFAVGVVLATVVLSSTTPHTSLTQASLTSSLPSTQQLVHLTTDHRLYKNPSPAGRTSRVLYQKTPITHSPTVLPVLGISTNKKGSTWLRVRVPGRPNGGTGWITNDHTTLTSTTWKLRVQLGSRRILVFRNGTLIRSIPAIVGSIATPTPTGTFFVEETVALYPTSPGEPYALALSARSSALHYFDGGPGQIAIHATTHLAGSTASHGCIRVSASQDKWLATHIHPGTPVIIEN
jgi:lipoprotein-anchoring transpeptidase ErfK/SrfK